MLYIGNISQIPRATQRVALDEIWAIVRSPKKLGNIPNMYHVPILSPSSGLFHNYLYWRENGSWNIETFRNRYVPLFLRQMNGQDERNKLNMLYSKVKLEGKNILLVCFCKEEQLCHRSIIAGLMNGVGLPVYDVNGSSVNYASYYAEYRMMEGWR